MKMKCICKENFEINGVLVGIKGDELEVFDAVPNDGESAEDVSGYCDIINLTRHELFLACWSEVEGDGALTNVIWLDEFIEQDI